MKVDKTYLLLYLIVIILASACSDKTKAIQKIEVGDIDQFGTSLVGKKVEFKARINRAYACQLPTNLGNQCLEVNNKFGDIVKAEAVIIKDGAYSIEQYRDWIKNKNLLKLNGKVELRLGSDIKYKENTMSPVLFAEKIEAMD